MSAPIISASAVKQLRERTGSGMMDCKNALVEANGDFDKAIEILRKKGQKIAAKRADRTSLEGAAISLVNENKNKGVALVIGCETDFVARNEDFLKLAHTLLASAIHFTSKEDFLASAFEGGSSSVAEKLVEYTGVTGEKIEISGFEAVEAPFVGSYIHAGNRIATLVGFSAAPDKNATEMGEDVAMQVAAMNPLALDESGVDMETLEKEREIAKDQLRKEGKPEAMLDSIAEGKVKRFLKENTLVNQPFIKEAKQTVAQYVKSQGDIQVTGFKRLAIGE